MAVQPHQAGRYQKSRTLFAQACESLAGGVSSQFRAQTPYPISYRQAKGSRLWDADGNEYIDWTLSQGPMILGHGYPAVQEAVQATMREGLLLSSLHEMEIDLSRRMVASIPCAERVRFSSVGSEVVQTALRLARAATGRRKVVKFEGHYHGWFDNVAISIHPSVDQAGPSESPVPVPWSEGQAQSVLGDVIILPWNDVAALRRAFADHRDAIAGVISEPIMCNTSCIMPRSEYLQTLRDLCTENGSVLIFDEIITGFRLALGGAQEYIGVTPDLATFGKAMGNGFPISMLAGNKDLMDIVASGRCIHAGTFNSNTAAVAAALATTKVLARDAEVYEHLFSTGRTLMDGLRRIFADRGLSALVQGPGPVFHVGFTHGSDVHDYRSAQSYDNSLYERFVQAMLDRGVRLIGRGIWYVSLAHTAADVDATLEAADNAAHALRS